MNSAGSEHPYHQSGTSLVAPLSYPRFNLSGEPQHLSPPAPLLSSPLSSPVQSPPPQASQPRQSDADGWQPAPVRPVSRQVEKAAGTVRRAKRYRFLTASEWALFAHAVGAVRDTESHVPIHPRSGLWPPRQMAPGLYRDVVAQRVKFCYLFHALSMVRWVSLMLQLGIGASLTAIGSIADTHGLVVTILAAANTVIAGLMALLHNSGLPDRYRSDQVEFSAVEDYIRELLDAGLIDDARCVNEIIADCFDRYQEAKATVQANLPASYTPSRQFSQSAATAFNLPDGVTAGPAADVEADLMANPTRKPAQTGHPA